MEKPVCPIERKSKLDIEYCQSDFKLHSFYTEVNNDIVMIQVIKMMNSLYLWIGYKNNPNLQDLSLAMGNKYGTVPISTKLLGESIEETSKNMANKLCKKLNKVVYVSLNVEDNKFNIPVIEKRIQEEIVNYPVCF